MSATSLQEADELLKLMLKMGLTVTKSPGNLIVVSPTQKLTEPLREQIKACKPALLQRLDSDERSGLSAMRQQLLEAVNRACDHFGDTPAMREIGRLETLAIAPDDVFEWLEHFTKAYPKLR